MILRHKQHGPDTDLEAWLRDADSVCEEQTWARSALMRAEQVLQREAVRETEPLAARRGLVRWAAAAGALILIGVTGVSWFLGSAPRGVDPAGAESSMPVIAGFETVPLEDVLGASPDGGAGAAALSQLLGYKRTGGALRISAYANGETGTASFSGPVFRIEAYGGPVRLEAQES